MLITTPNKAVGFIKNAYKAKQPIFIWGSPGVGKSDAVRKATNELGLDIIDVRASQLDAVDLRGVPYVNQEDSTTQWATPNFLPTEGKGILFLDEMNSASVSVQAALYQLILDRKLGDYTLPEGWICLGAGNKDTDRGVTTRMPTPLANRFAAHLEVTVSVDDWINWGIQNGVSAEVISYIKFRPDNLYKFNPTSGDKAFATPRSWMFVDNWIKVMDDAIDAMPLIQGAIGEAVAIDFKTHLTLYAELPDIESILAGKNPSFDSTDPALCYALTASLGHHADIKNFSNIVAYVEEHISPEYQVLTAKYITMKDAPLREDKVFLDFLRGLSDLII